MNERPNPTEAELAILQVLWEGPNTVRGVLEHPRWAREVGYTTVLKLLQIMTDKGLVVRDASQRSHVYRAAHRRETTERKLVGDLLERAFAGSSARLVLRALSDKPASPEEIAEIRRLLDELEAREA